MNKIAIAITATIASLGSATYIGLALGESINADAQTVSEVKNASSEAYEPPYTECGDPVRVGTREDGMPRHTVDLCNKDGDVVQTVIYSGE